MRIPATLLASAPHLIVMHEMLIKIEAAVEQDLDQILQLQKGLL